jgi:RimJ/RimL family protein N-acetyltransferase
MHKLLIDLPDCFETPRLLVRPYRAGDGLAYFDVCQRNREHLLPFERGNAALSVTNAEETEILMREFAAAWVKRDVFFLGAWETSTGAFAAQLYVGVVSWELPEFEIGYFADVNHAGKGFVSEMVRHAALPLVFDFLGARRACIHCNETNIASWRVAERCGFVREGHLRATKPHIPLPDGSASGDYLYGLLREDYYEQLHKNRPAT